ncbi:MAG: GNAT family N-acetyltransferase [Chloroflexi bacterium]|nr:GNAT family N-acetyltransferase [Chloroflexota bacterium]
MNILETPRLLLRRLTDDDLDDLYALYQDAEVRKFFPEGTLDREQTKEELDWHKNGHPEHPELGLWATIHKESGTFIGRCGLLPWTIDGVYEVEVAYTIARDHWRQGYGSEAARGCLEYGFNTLGRTRLIAMVDHNNVASQKVAARMGMHHEKDGEDELGPFMLWSVERGGPNDANA